MCFLLIRQSLFQGGRDPVVAYDNWQETRTVEELERIKSAFILLFVRQVKTRIKSVIVRASDKDDNYRQDANAVHMEGLTIR